VISASGLEGLIGEVGSDSGDTPIALNISSLGEVAISRSNEDIVGRGASFGTALNIVPSGILASNRPVNVHLLVFALLSLDGLSVGEEGTPKVISTPDNVKACVVGVGGSVPFRLKIEMLRRAILLEAGS
jgi:hypothetical protein